jgi:hypothetical protein
VRSYRGDINAISTASVYKCTPVTAAARYGKIETLRLILSLGADETKEDGNGRSPLRVAAANDNGSLQVLLQLCPGLNLDKVDAVDGTTPLNRAAHFGMESAARLLLALGADLSIRNNNDKTAEDEAIAEGHHRIAVMIAEEVSALALLYVDVWGRRDAWLGHGSCVTCCMCAGRIRGLELFPRCSRRCSCRSAGLLSRRLKRIRID